MLPGIPALGSSHHFIFITGKALKQHEIFLDLTTSREVDALPALGGFAA